MNRLIRIPLLLCLTMAAQGCVRRVIDITSDPPGARVWVNDREVGPHAVRRRHQRLRHL